MATLEINRRGPKRSVQFTPDLRRAREHADLTQEALAAAADVSIDSIRRAECGKPVLLETARAIGGGLNISFEKLLLAVDKPVPNKRGPQKQIIGGEPPYYKLYSEGELVQRITVDIPSYTEDIFVVYPISFPNEVTHIRPVGDMTVTVKRITLSNCSLAFIAGSTARKIDLIISGF